MPFERGVKLWMAMNTGVCSAVLSASMSCLTVR